MVPLALAAGTLPCPAQALPAEPDTSYTRSLARYPLPEVTLVDMDGAEVPLADALGRDGSVFLQFIFTTCPGVCPALSTILAATQRELGPELDRVRLVSISIDPEHDTPERLREYARRFGAGPSWHFYTGELAAVEAVQKAFDAYRGNKMRHEPTTYLRASPAAPWLRIDGFLTGAELVAEYRALAERAPNPELGERIYRQGLLPSGEPLSATALGAIEVEGPQLACAACHRRSGFGSVEGGAYVPPVTAPALFRPREPDRADLFRRLYQEVQPRRLYSQARDPRIRPAYDDASLAAALREGRDPSGRALDPLMPRYRLSATDLGHLTSYLHTLAARPDPGVDATTLHLATVVAGNVDPEKRREMLAVMEAYVRRKNAETEGLLRLAGGSPWHRDDFLDSYRIWELHVWELSGSPGAWTGQLLARYREQPVFAVVGGLAAGGWAPIQQFCEAVEVPCLFPATDLPPPEGGEHSLYLSQGLTGEALALAHYLHEGVGAGGQRVLQIYRKGGPGEVPARALRRALVAGLTEAGASEQGRESALDSMSAIGKPAPLIRTNASASEIRPRGKQPAQRGDSALRLEDLALASGALPERSVLSEVRAHLPRTAVDGGASDEDSTLVLWLEAADLADLDLAQLLQAGWKRVFLSTELLGGAVPEVPPAAWEKVLFTYPYALPGEEPPRIHRVRGWLRSRGVAGDDERIQLNTFFALSVVDHALVHLVESFSRDYLVESVEHETENALNPGVFPRLTLGPGQRFASKGAYVVRVIEGGGLEAVSDWIVP